MINSWDLLVLSVCFSISFIIVINKCFAIHVCVDAVEEEYVNKQR